jgi:hypothetical protein
MDAELARIVGVDAERRSVADDAIDVDGRGELLGGVLQARQETGGRA